MDGQSCVAAQVAIDHSLIRSFKIVFIKPFIIFLLKFLGLFCLLYFGTLAIIGLAAPEGWYSPFVAAHLDYVSGLKLGLMWGVKILLSLFGIQTSMHPGFVIRVLNGRGVTIAMSCVGYGVYSFWIAYVVSSSVTLFRKLWWTIGGLLALWLINTIRIAMFLVAVDRNKEMPLGLDHHTWFTIVAYACIFAMIWLFEKQRKEANPLKIAAGGVSKDLTEKKNDADPSG